MVSIPFVSFFLVSYTFQDPKIIRDEMLNIMIAGRDTVRLACPTIGLGVLLTLLSLDRSHPYIHAVHAFPEARSAEETATGNP